MYSEIYCEDAKKLRRWFLGLTTDADTERLCAAGFLRLNKYAARGGTICYLATGKGTKAIRDTCGWEYDPRIGGQNDRTGNLS